MPIIDVEITIPIEIAYYKEDGKIIVDAVLVCGTGQQLPMSDAIALKIKAICRDDYEEGKRG